MNQPVEIDTTRIPRHIAIIMDGNGRWAKLHGKSRSFGHQEGVVSVKETISTAARLGVGHLTLYTFSTENWSRPQEEVDALMTLLVKAIERETPVMMRQHIRLKSIGDLTRLPLNARGTLEECIKQTSENNGLTVTLALSYSSRWEIVNAIKQIVHNGIKEELITDKVLESYLATTGLPDPDLLIRTGGEQRISNFLLWQLSYTELYFTETYWPDFRERQLIEAICDYQSRERRFGKITEQLV